MDVNTLSEIKTEFQYFYPVDARHSGRDLVPNHLTFFVLNHVAIFPEKDWPKEIVVNGSVLMNGSKMSKSMGNIIPLRKAIQDHGADPVRLAIIISAELLQDADFNIESVSGVQSRLESLYEECTKLEAGKIGNLEAEDRWILSKTQIMVSQVSAAVKKMRLREALHGILFAFESELGWYQKRAKAKNRRDISAILHQVMSTRILMLSPFAPHIAEEMWERLGHDGLVSKARWPESLEQNIDAASIQSEELLRSTVKDIAHILKVAKIAPQRIIMYTSNDTKSKVYYAILEKVMSGQTNMGVIMKELIADKDTSDVKKNPDFVQRTIKDILSEPADIKKARLESKIDEQDLLATEFPELASAEFGVDIQILSESDPDIYDPKDKARHARPFKPAILVE